MLRRRGRGRMPPGPRFTWRGRAVVLVGIAVLVAAVLLERHDLLTVGLILVAVPAAGLAVTTRSTPAVRVRRVVTPAIVAVGDDALIDVEFSGDHRRLAGEGGWREPLPDGMDDLGPAGRSRDGAGRIRVRRRVRPRRRGVFTLDPVVVDVRDVFGFAHRRVPVGSSVELVVVPAAVDLEADTGAPLAAEGEEQQAIRRVNESVDELSAREYRPGDPLRRVHWRATARFGELMVRQEEQGTSPQAWIVVDTATGTADPAAAAAGGDVPFERMVRMLASVAARLIDDGHHIGIAETGARQLAGGPGVARIHMEAGGCAVYSAGRGVHGLRVELASFAPPSGAAESAAVEPAASLHRSRSAAPVFALLRGVDAPLLAMLRTLPALSTTTCAFLFAPIPDADRDILVDAGWQVIPVGDDLAAAWQAAAARSGAAGGAS